MSQSTTCTYCYICTNIRTLLHALSASRPLGTVFNAYAKRFANMSSDQTATCSFKLAKVNPSVCMYTCSDMRDWEIFEFTFYECHIIPKLMIIYPGNEKLKDAQEMLSY